MSPNWRKTYPDFAAEVPALIRTMRELGSALECLKPDYVPSGEPSTQATSPDLSRRSLTKGCRSRSAVTAF